MKNQNKSESSLLHTYRFAALIFLIWTAILACSLAWNIYNARQQIRELAKNTARSNFNKDQAFRLWATDHGGVYVPVDEKTFSNPYLSHLPERDIKTPSGKPLTLMNPAYMLRQMMDEFSDLYGMKGHITSLKPLRPENNPDEWEKKALVSFEKGGKEAFEFTEINGMPYLRLMRPMITRKGCLKCHAQQGYKEGDIRGGVGVSIPMDPFLSIGRKEIVVLVLSHSLIWLLGLAAIIFISYRSKQRNVERERTEEALRDSEERYLHVLEADVAARKKAEKELEAAHQFLKSVIDSVAEPIMLIGTDYRVILMNRVAREFLTREMEDSGQLFCYSVSHNRSTPCSHEEGHPCPIMMIKESGKTTTVIHEHYKPDGEIRYWEIMASPLLDPDGKLTGIIESARDVTERKLLEDQLRQAQKMEAIGQLAGGIAHDFNNILTAVIGYASLLQMKMKEDDALRIYVDQVLSASKRAANLTQGLLAFSRKQIINPVPLDLNEVVKRIEKLLWRFIGEDIEFRTVLTETELMVMADPGQIEQVLMNLVTNARDAMPEGGALIISTELVKLGSEYIGAHFFAVPGVYALVSVSDTGTGMDENTKERIFEPFFTTKELGRGTGLGLSIVYGIIKQHDGFINVYSEIGKGSTFKIYMPLIRSSVQEAEPARLVPLKGGNETILLAEDEPEVRTLARAVLEEFGYTVIEAVDGVDAVNKFTENSDRIQLLILDVVMPRKNGKEAFDEIRMLRPDIRALFASGYAAEVVYRKGITADALNFIAKPVSPDDLLRRVREVLDR